MPGKLMVTLPCSGQVDLTGAPELKASIVCSLGCEHTLPELHAAAMAAVEEAAGPLARMGDPLRLRFPRPRGWKRALMAALVLAGVLAAAGSWMGRPGATPDAPREEAVDLGPPAPPELKPSAPSGSRPGSAAPRPRRRR